MVLPVADLARWREVGDRIYVRRYDDPFDLNIGLVLGDEAALVVDTRTNPAEALALQAEIDAFTKVPLRVVFNTHEHWDHTFGNQVFGSARIWGHERCRLRLLENGESVRDRIAADYPDVAGYGEVVITPPTETFTETGSIDLGARAVALAYYGYGHTSNDAVVHVDGVTFGGDLVEEGNPPTFDDSYPIAWVETIGRLAAAARPVVVPGHGGPVDPEYLVMARFDLAWVARTAQAGKAAGGAVADLDLAGSPYPEEYARVALARAYAELSGSSEGKFSQ